ncbi:hypothetical protein GGD55_000779 [Rhizobium giardinii]|uniref:Uncharacterized protein n=1 Tax=Rhizobium giardinii TaxID=56731 RepID=A0A7W8X842_9HYPH|nr:hypothetical protein [Rhizobium giardinii]
MTYASVVAPILREVAASIEYAHDADRIVLDKERDRRATFKASDAQARMKIVALRTAKGKIGKGHACLFNTIDIDFRSLDAAVCRDVVIECDKIVFRRGTKDDFMRHSSPSSMARAKARENVRRRNIGPRIVYRFTNFGAHDFVQSCLFAIKGAQTCAHDFAC